MEQKFQDKFSNLDIVVHGVRLPKIEIPEHYYKSLSLEQNISNAKFLKALCEKGLRQKGKRNDRDYISRAKKELEIIEELSFTDYFLLIWDVINFCREKDIPTGAGRGSAAGSLVMYLIGVTGIDPIQNNLIFERFISKARAKSKTVDGVVYIDGSLAPDVDLDICTDRRVEVIEYLKTKYKGNFCKLPTISTMSSKAVLKDCGKIVENLSEEELMCGTREIPVKYGQPSLLKDAIEESQEFAKWSRNHEPTIEIAVKIEGLMRQKGSHASAYLVSYESLDNFLPCELDGEGEIISSFDMNYSQEESIKLDLLGLHGVTLIDRIKKSLGNNLEDFDPNDPWIYNICQTGDLPYGLFQIGASANYRVFKQVKPKNWEQLSAVIALARPGALAYVADYVDNEPNEYFGNKAMQEILAPTHNIPIYQEQAMAIAHKVFFFTLEDAEQIRRAVAKKKPEEVAKWKEKIYQAQEEHNLPKELADFYWNLLEESANYSFNASHSFSYSYLSALTLYLKYKYPQVFYTECLRMAQNKSDTQDHVALIEQELNFFGIKLLQPDLIKSKPEFSLEGENIRYGFSSIKGVSKKSLESLTNFLSIQKTNKFEVFNAAKQSKLNIGVVCALIQAGMLNSVSQDREMTVFEGQLWNLLTPKEQVYCLANGESYDFDLRKMIKNIEFWLNEKGKPLARKTRLDTIREKSKKYQEIYKQNSAYPKFASWYYEKSLLGYSYSTTLKDIFLHSKADLKNILEIKNFDCKQNIKGVFTIQEIKKGISKANNKYMKITIQDETGSFDAIMVGEKFENYERDEPAIKEGDIVYLVGQANPDIIFINSIKIQSTKIYTKLSDVKLSVDNEENSDRL